MPAWANLSNAVNFLLHKRQFATRAHHRLRTLSRTIADLAGEKIIRPAHQVMDRQSWP